MDVKDKPHTRLQGISTKKRKRPLKVARLSAGKLSQGNLPEDNPQVTSDQKRDDSCSATSVIEKVEEALQTTQEIGEIFQSIAGIVELADKEITERQKRERLQTEARELASQIEARLERISRTSLNPLPEEEQKRKKVEELLREIAELTPKSFGEYLSSADINLSSEQEIEATIRKVKRAKERIERLSGIVHETADIMKKAFTLTEIASENSTASEASIRELDEALRIAEETSLHINENPAAALGAIGLTKESLELLK